MKEEFVPYELAVKLKALGFDEPCLGYYYNKELSFGARTSYGEVIEAPTFSQCWRWFREKYHIIGYPIFKGGKTTQTAWYDYVIYSEIEWEVDNPNQQWKTYEESKLACLKKLIEIIENEN